MTLLKIKLLLLICFTCMSFIYADKMIYKIYQFGDSNENNVVSSSLNLIKEFNSKTNVSMDVELDQTYAPPILDGITGASRPVFRKNEAFEKNRGQMVIGVEQKLGSNSSFSGSYYFSKEIDFQSNSVAFKWAQELLQKNVTLKLKGQYTFDRVGKIHADGSFSDTTKESRNGGIQFTQILSKTSVLGLQFDYFELVGKLSNPYRQITTIEKDLRNESTPLNRIRSSLSVKYNQIFPPIKGSLILSYRYYWDSWAEAISTAREYQINNILEFGVKPQVGLRASTIRLKLNKYITSNWIVSPSYRYHTQDRPFFVKDVYSNLDPYFVDDHKLQTFTSNTFGISTKYHLRDRVKENSTLMFLQFASVTLGYYNYTNSLDFSGYIIESDISFDF